MFRLLLVTALCTLIAHAAHASLEDFERKPFRAALFGVQDDAGETTDRKDRFEGDRTGLSSLAFWLTPSMRFTSDPSSTGVGFGGEGSHSFTDRIGLMAAFGIWDMRVLAKKDNGDETRRGALMFELEAGPRVRMRVWPNGSLYGDMRVGLSIAGGSEPVRSTTSLGAGAYFGFEFGGDMTRLYLEIGLAWRGALNRTNAGWLDAGDRNTQGGVSFEALRIGIRVYF